MYGDIVCVCVCVCVCNIGLYEKLDNKQNNVTLRQSSFSLLLASIGPSTNTRLFASPVHCVCVFYCVVYACCVSLVFGVTHPLFIIILLLHFLFLWL
jgi:hypothetical protein